VGRLSFCYRCNLAHSVPTPFCPLCGKPMRQDWVEGITRNQDPERFAACAEYLTLALARGLSRAEIEGHPDATLFNSRMGFLPHELEWVAMQLGFLTDDGQYRLPADHPLVMSP
jgi:hypothetical protein